MAINNQQYIGKDLRNSNFDGENLTGTSFINCNLSGASFNEANLERAVFELCKTDQVSPIDFENANLKEVTINECEFNNGIFKNAQIINASVKNSSFSGANFLGCRFNGSLIEDIDISKTQLHMSSFLDAQILSITFRPFLKIPTLRGLNFFKRTNQIYRTIFINHNTHIDFTNFCHSESRKDKLFSFIESKKGVTRFFILTAISLFGVLTNYGTSLVRWLFCAIGIIAMFGLFYFFSENLPLEEAFIASLIGFFNIGMESNISSLFIIAESICGYFMLGILISLITSKIQIS